MHLSVWFDNEVNPGGGLLSAWLEKVFHVSNHTSPFISMYFADFEPIFRKRTAL